MTHYFPDIAVFLFGLCIGSFLNVCIYRVPAGQSIVHPGSTCPGCRQPIRFYDNIPLLSYLLLRGRCRRCGIAIPLRYPLVEALTGFFALITYLTFGPTLTALVHFVFAAALLTVTFIDIDHRIIPDVISLPGIVVFFIASFWLPTVSWLDAALGVLIGGGSLLAIAWGYRLATGKEGMGGGDVKLLAMIGAMIGWQGVLFTIFAASATGTLAGVLHMLQTRSRDLKTAIPFGPFLAIGALVYLFWGDPLIEWYWDLLG